LRYEIALSKSTTITVTLSVDPYIKDFFSTFSTAFQTNLSIFTALNEAPSLASRLKVAQISFPMVFSSSTSNIPSLASNKKLCFEVSILKCLMSGSAVTTRGLPPNYVILHSMSPNAQLIASHPGITHVGD